MVNEVLYIVHIRFSSQGAANAMRQNTGSINVRLPVSIKRAAEKYAEEDGRTASALLRKLLNDFLKEHEREQKAAK